MRTIIKRWPNSINITCNYVNWVSGEKYPIPKGFETKAWKSNIINAFISKHRFISQTRSLLLILDFRHVSGYLKVKKALKIITRYLKNIVMQQKYNFQIESQILISHKLVLWNGTLQKRQYNQKILIWC